MIVASDTSPITSLAAIGQFELLRTLYGEVHIAEGVWQELNHGGGRHPGSHEVETAPWVHRHEVRDPAFASWRLVYIQSVDALYLG